MIIVRSAKGVDTRYNAQLVEADKEDLKKYKEGKKKREKKKRG